MSLLKTTLLFSTARNLSTTCSARGWWNKDWKPAPCPTSEEEVKASAKKYGLLPEEYKVAPDDGFGIGDYPHLKPISAESRDPFYPWDFPEYRRNYGEVIHPEACMYGEDRYDVNMKIRIPVITQLSMFLGVIGGAYLLMILGKDGAFLPVAKHHMPEPGVKHYTYN